MVNPEENSVVAITVAATTMIRARSCALIGVLILGAYGGSVVPVLVPALLLRFEFGGGRTVLLGVG
jgi:hypothetical protein